MGVIRKRASNPNDSSTVLAFKVPMPRSRSMECIPGPSVLIVLPHLWVCFRSGSIYFVKWGGKRLLCINSFSRFPPNYFFETDTDQPLLPSSSPQYSFYGTLSPSQPSINPTPYPPSSAFHGYIPWILPIFNLFSSSL